MEDPAKRPGEVLAKQVLAWRKRRNLSVQALADRIAEIGGTLSRVAISRIENGNRSVSLDEWLQLAHALAVPPPLLFLDLEQGKPVQIAENVTIYPWLAWQWVVGDQAPVMTDRTVTRVEEWHQARTAIGLYTDQAEASRKIERALSHVRAADFIGAGQQGISSGQLATARAVLVDGLRELAASLDEMVEVGMTAPTKPADWVEAIRKLGLSRHPDSLRAFGAPSGARWVAEINGPTLSRSEAPPQDVEQVQEGGHGER